MVLMFLQPGKPVLNVSCLIGPFYLLKQVNCVDFGNTEWVPEVTLRDLDLRFIHLTLQAVECTLDGIATVDDSGQWPPEAWYD